MYYIMTNIPVSIITMLSLIGKKRKGKSMKIDSVRNIAEEVRFEYKGYPCVVLFMEPGYRCGYVGIPNKTYDIDFEEVIDCHGGITYGPSDHLHFQEDNDILWIGFDCTHYCDGYDITLAEKVFSLDRLTHLYGSRPQGNVRSLEYCENECRNIVDQLIELQEAENMLLPGYNCKQCLDPLIIAEKEDWNEEQWSALRTIFGYRNEPNVTRIVAHVEKVECWNEVSKS